MDYTIGFTGTRKGITNSQWVAVDRMLTEIPVSSQRIVARHGCCLGADTQFAQLVRARLPNARIIGHPCTLKGMVSEHALACCNIILNTKQPLERNRDIVEACDELIACPEGPEKIRSGTWPTIRFAKKCGKPVRVIFPDGRVEAG